MATCGIASGARPVLSTLSDAVQQEGLSKKISVTQTGCIGLCQYEPIVEVMAVSYTHLIWLNKMMENILSMTKIESGAQFIEKSQEVVDDLVYEAKKHIIGLKEHRDFRSSLPKEVIAVSYTHLV